ncbi:MAG: hypothetical protein ACYC91_08960 [Solirubrobacteraceae bacterium]
MTLARAWRRQLFGAMGASLAVPGALVVAFALLALAGSFSGLGTIGQAISGPALPPVGSAPGQNASRAAQLSLLDRHSLRPAGSGSAGTLGTGTASSAVRPGTSGASSGGSPGRGGGGGGSGAGPSGSAGPGSRGSAGPGSGGRPVGTGPHKPPTLVDHVVSAGTTITTGVPGPAGGVVTQTLQSLGATLDRVLPLGAPVAGWGRTRAIVRPARTR